MMRRIIAIMLSFVMTLGMSTTAFADPEAETPVGIEITEDYLYTNKISSDLSISNHTATCKSVVRGDSSVVTKVEVTHTLQKQIYGYWSDIESWSKTVNTWYVIYTTSRSNLSAGMFRLKTVAKVYSGSNYETITVYSIEKSSVN